MTLKLYSTNIAFPAIFSKVMSERWGRGVGKLIQIVVCIQNRVGEEREGNGSHYLIVSFKYTLHPECPPLAIVLLQIATFMVSETLAAQGRRPINGST